MQKTWRSHVLLAYSLAILAFLYVPLVILAMYSFNDSRINAVWTGFTFRWYEQLFNNRRVLEALINTLIIVKVGGVQVGALFNHYKLFNNRMRTGDPA